MLSSVPALKRIVTAASLAPTGDNAQPWLFRWNGDELRITQDNARAAHSLNRSNHASLLSLGCVIESIAIAASREGLKIDVDFQKDQLINTPHAIVRFKPSAESVDELHEALNIRCADRRPFQKGSIHTRFIEQIRMDAATIPGTAIYFQDQFSDEFLNYVSESDSFVIEHKKPHHDVMNWLRFSDKEAAETRDGLPWRNLGLSYAESRVLSLSRNFTIQRILNFLGFTKVMKKNALKLVKSSAGIGCITVKSPNPEDLVNAGRLWMRAWCRLNLNGYGLQPMTSGSFPIYDTLTGVMPNNIAAHFRKLFSKGLEILKVTFGFSNNEIPILIFRTGVTTPLPENAKTFRLRIEDVLNMEKK